MTDLGLPTVTLNRLTLSDIHEFADLVPFRFRAAHRLWANSQGYFWLPCPLCGQEFGGHEWRDIDGKPAQIPDGDRPGAGVGICPDCTRAGKGSRLPVVPQAAKAEQ